MADVDTAAEALVSAGYGEIFDEIPGLVAEVIENTAPVSSPSL
jgi:hypothetical protein